MKATKLLLSSLILAGVFSACTKQEYLDVQTNNESLAQRTQVNLTLSTPVETRMGLDANGNFVYTTNDVVGAVLVDAGYSESANSAVRTDDPFIYNNVDWTVVKGHVGNNKWYFDGAERAFKTKSTTAVGAWMFYSKYNEDMTTTRDGVKTSFPQIQEGSTDWTWLANNNLNFVVSPILNIDGYEGENIDLPIKYSSVYNYLNIKLKFKAADSVTTVNKILVSAIGTDDKVVYFPASYKVNNQAIPTVDLSLNENSLLAVADIDDDEDLTKKDQELAIQHALWTMNNTRPNATTGRQEDAMDWTADIALQAKNFVVKDGSKVYPYLVLDCDANHLNTKDAADMAVVNDNFSTWMLMPAGLYKSITLTIYTDKGVYTEEVNSREAYLETYNALEDKTVTVDEGVIYLRPNTQTSLANIERRTASTSGANFSAAVDYVYVNGTAVDADNVITKTSDLISLINSIKVEGVKDVNIISQSQIGDPSNGVDDAALPEHALIINQDVMDALKAKETALGKDIQLNFLGAKVKIVGNASSSNRLNVHDMTFNMGCDVVSGYVHTSNDIVIPQYQTMAVKGGANVTMGTNIVSENVTNNFANLSIEEGAGVTVKENMIIENIVNYGTFATTNVELDVDLFTNTENASATLKGDVNIVRLANSKNANLVNTNVLTVASTDYYGTSYPSKNTSTITVKNGAVMNVIGSFENIGGTITIEANAKVVVNSEATGTLVNKNTDAKDAVIVNNGMLYTTQGDNTIHNYATIEAKGDSYTYITTNSLFDETITGSYTGAADQIMGTIKMEKRNAEMKVSNLKQQGYKEYAVVATDLTNSVLSAASGDKFNKVILTTAATLSADVVKYVNFVVTSGNLTLPAGALIQEATFVDNVALYAPIAADVNDRVVICSIEVAKGKQLRIPTENAIYVYTKKSKETVHGFESATSAMFKNFGEILVGGDVYTKMSLATAESTSTYTDGTTTKKGLFSTGFGENDVFHWSTEW